MLYQIQRLKVLDSIADGEIRIFFNRRSLFENRSLVDFEIGNERKVRKSLIYENVFPLPHLNNMMT